MKIGFSSYDWKDIMRVCGAVVAEDETQIVLTYIKIECDNGRFTAIGSNGYQVSQVSGACQMQTDGKSTNPVTFLLPPQKTPAKTKRVEVVLNVEVWGGKTVLCFYDKDENMITTYAVDGVQGEYIDIQRIIKGCTEKIESYNHGEGAYMIAVNPRCLLAALKGMKNCGPVVFNFASPNEAFMVRSYRDDSTMALVYPVRIPT